jgi:hypothetical protein
LNVSFFLTYSIVRFNAEFKLVVSNFSKARGKRLICILGGCLRQNAWVSSEKFGANEASFLAIGEVPHRLVAFETPCCWPVSTQKFVFHDLDKSEVIN